MFKFNTNPAAMSVTDGIQTAFSFLTENWRKWLPFMLMVAAGQAIIFLVIGQADANSLYTIDENTGLTKLSPDAGTRLASFAWAYLLSLALTTVAGWGFAAIAIGALRGWQVTPAVIFNRGILAFVASIVAAIVILVVLVLWIILLIAVPAIGILALFVGFFVGIYFGIRYMTFVTLAIFDGQGVFDGFRESWRLTERAVLRTFGWLLMSGLISVGFGFVSGIVGSPALGVVGAALGGAVTGTYSAFSVFFMANLYESQRARNDPNLYPYAPPMAPAYPAAYPTTYPGTPYAGGYPGAPMPGQYPGAAPNWPPAQPGATPGWPPAQPGAAPGWPPAQPPAGTSWSPAPPPPPPPGWPQTPPSTPPAPPAPPAGEQPPDPGQEPKP